MALLICFGDSICYGYGARPGEAWVDRLSASLAALPAPVRVQNAGVNGETSEDALRRMPFAVESFKPDAVYVQFGLNDCSWWCGQEGKPWVSREKYIANMREIVRRSFACGARVVFVAANHPVGNDPYGMSGYRKNVADCNEALREAFTHGSGETGKELVFVDIEQGILGSPGLDPAELLAADGVHLSAAGNAWYAKWLTEIISTRLAGAGVGK